MGSKLILNKPKINNKNQKIELEIFGLIRHSTKHYPQMLQKPSILVTNKYFPKLHRLHKIFNRNTVEVNYSCMWSMSKIYKEHNSKITSRPCNHLILCNCQVKEECLMDGKYQTMDTKNLLCFGRRKIEDLKCGIWRVVYNIGVLKHFASWDIFWSGSIEKSCLLG